MSTINEFKTTNGRLARYVWKRIMNQYVARHDSLEEPITTEGYVSAINDFLCKIEIIADEKKNALPKELKTEFEETCLSKDNLEWIDPNSERLCLWLWNCVKSYSFKSADSQPEENLDSDELRSLSEVLALDLESLADSSQEPRGYITFGLDGSYNTPKEHYNAIITCLDMWQAPIRLKREFNNEHKKLWEEVVAYGNFNWFVPVKKKEDEDWFFQYINKALAAYIQPERTPWDLSKTMPIAILRFDSWVPDFTREKEFFLKDMRKAWSQKKHRYKMKKDDRKAYSVVMHKNVNSHLEEMAESTGMSKNEFLELLITSEYKSRVYSEK
ncbi:CopG family transcriptional regulator [Vibrio crassostreae]|nr:CopG family transcriptional regulator [Vibrio crassostreae]CAK1922946.1 CopG family transcriptional regulator [Vibrio crassostreae]CAK1928781.1 CopG family transcriptional regulator [Vibrio crassostreae]CAK2311833.1 CopG family transcriptional regulator [Vibrio crassostreae]CAK2312320.1 CopG family transcriptional regulator [Vibrio crassostreae]